MSDTTDTARRERALKWATSGAWNDDEWADIEWAQDIGNAAYNASEFFCAYLAGSREEAAIKDAEIETLRTTYDSLVLHCTQCEALLQSLIELRNEQMTEIAALWDVISLQGSALREIRIRLHAAGRRPEDCYEMSILDDTIAAVRRALGEKR